MRVLVLQEGSRPNEIGYHFTNLEGLAAILNLNTMKATNEPVKFDKVSQMWKPISSKYAEYDKSWSYTRKKSGMFFRGNNLKDSVRITFDIDKLSERQRIFPFSWKWGKNEAEFEFEERVEGDTNNIKDFIKEITFSPALNFNEKNYYEISKKSSKNLANILSIINRFNYIEEDTRHFNNVKGDWNPNIFFKLDNLVTKEEVSEKEVFDEFINIYSRYSSLSEFGKEMSNYFFSREFMRGKDFAEELQSDFRNLSNPDVLKFEDIFSKKSTKSKRSIFDKFLTSLSFDFDEFISKNNIKVSYMGASADSGVFYDEDSKDIKVFSKKEADTFLNSVNKRFEKVKGGIESITNSYKDSLKSFSKKGMSVLWKSFYQFGDYLFERSIDNVFQKLKIRDTDRIICFDNEKNLIVSTNPNDLSYINKFVKTKFKETEHKYCKVFHGENTASASILYSFWGTSSSSYTGAKLKERINSFNNRFDKDRERTGFFFLVSGKIYELKVLRHRDYFKLTSHIAFSFGKRNVEMSELITSQISIDKFARIAEKKIDK